MACPNKSSRIPNESSSETSDLRLRDMPFAQLVEADPNLAETRRVYARKTARERRAAAAWEYDAAFAGSLFADACAAIGAERWPPADLEAGVLALAIDPGFAPALLTVGSIEYEYGRPDAAMELFLRLTTLPEDEEDIVEIIDKAGGFLLDETDYANALRLFAAAAEASPMVPTYWSGVGYCLVKLDRVEEGIAATMRCVDLEPESPVWLNDLGYMLLEAGRLEEARRLLEKAVALAPQSYDQPRANLEELERRTGRPTDGGGSGPWGSADGSGKR